jgi:protein Tex
MSSIQDLSTTYNIWQETLKDILQELQKPGHDPRDDLAPPVFASNVMEITDLKIGDLLDGVVRNITDFWAFVDVGLHSDGLVHKSQLADRYVAHPMDIVHLGQAVKVRVLEIDLEKEKISLSMKTWVAVSSSVPKSTPAKQTTPQKKELPESPGLSATIKFT